MRLRLNSSDSLVGTLMVGDAVGEVIESRAANFVAGDIAMGKIGWQEYGVLDAGQLRKIDPSVAPISTSLGILGMPGLTAYFGLFEIGRPIAGDTVVVSAASGAVGAVVGVERIMWAFGYTAIAGGVLALIWALHRGRLTLTLLRVLGALGRPGRARATITSPGAHNRFPYGPAIAVGSVLAVLLRG